MTENTPQQHQEEGVKLFRQKAYEEAMKQFHQAQTGFEAAGQADMAAEMAVNIGLVHRSLGENQQALDAMEVALHTFEMQNDRLRTAMVLGNMGGTFAAMGDREQAHACYRRAADAFQELGEKKLHGETLIAMAGLQVKEGKLGAGAATYEVGLSELDGLNASQKVLKGLIGIRKRLTGGD